MKNDEINKMVESIDLIVESIQKHIEYLVYECKAKKKDKKLLKLMALEKDMLRMKELSIIVNNFRSAIKSEKHEIKTENIIDLVNPKLVENIRNKIGIDEK